MKLHTFQYNHQAGWTINQFPDLDSANTLILIFAAPEYINSPEPIHELARHYPNSKIMGCDTTLRTKNIPPSARAVC